MSWCFLIVAADRPRVLSRVVQIFDNHAVSIAFLTLQKLGDVLRMSITTDTDASKGARIEALLLRLHDVQSVESEQRVTLTECVSKESI